MILGLVSDLDSLHDSLSEEFSLSHAIHSKPVTYRIATVNKSPGQREPAGALATGWLLRG
jgi:hypothetical protein